MEEQRAEAASERVLVDIEGPLAVLRLGEPHERAIVLTESRMASLRQAIADIAADRSIEGLVITGARAGFCAGADIAVIARVGSVDEGARLAEEGQSVFAALEALRIPTVAAIVGACVGGGCELALACRYRVMFGSPESRIGLPEVKLGILPGFGGTQRLPQLIGIQAALGIILNGRLLGADEALKKGLVDRVVSADEVGQSEPQTAVETVAADIALGRTKMKRRALSKADWLATHTKIGRQIVRWKAGQTIQKETKGFYPAPPKALESVLFGLDRGGSEGYRREARLLGELIATDECKALVHIFNISEAASKLGRAKSSTMKSAEVAVVGAGVMGAGIAAVCLSKGMAVSLMDLSAEALERGKSHIEGWFAKRRNMSSEARAAALAKLTATSSLAPLAKATGEAPHEDSSKAGALPTAPVRILIEAVIEDISVKKKIFAEAAGWVGPAGVLASNTSSLSISELAAEAARPDAVLGIHFFNPAEKMPLIEIVKGRSTGDDAVLTAAAFATRLGKYPIIVEDVRGFLVNRILSPYLTEASHLLQDGFTVAAIDRAAKGFGMPMGPCRLLDEVGLDVAAKVSEIMVGAYGERMAGPSYADALLARGDKGKKSGRGFYRYDGESETVTDDLASVLGTPATPAPQCRAEDILDRLLMRLVNEAVLCLDEGVAGSPGPDAVRQIDLGSVMGFGFPPFRGGVLRYAAGRGVGALVTRMSELTDRYGPRFTPCEGLTHRARSGEGL